jgi:hypothetical protein
MHNAHSNSRIWGLGFCGAVRLTRLPVNCRTLLLVFPRNCDETVSYHLYIVTRHLWVLVPHTIRICL